MRMKCSPVAMLAVVVLGAMPSLAWAQADTPDGLATTQVPMNSFVPTIEPGPVPNRTLQCQLSRATNVDPSKEQKEEEIVYEGDYPLTIALPATSLPQVAGVGTGQPDQKPDAGYRVVADPNQLFRDFPPTGFDRVADYWPKHVELGQTVMGKAFQFIIVEEVPGQPGTTSIFISRAADAVSIDVKWLFRGECRLATGA